ncbi:MAG TPA: toll/interleukin-1 receptor domain-containing protein [Saprospiraceae bacterium]|nr:toll/interleukin-1 receptor domain-containing protein [Saprospiraceae bacterium]HND87414.1 toll/interleukin-1 receptor domain-containing protein [Saprospiraceae bacterium]HNG90796.1 toll/interleukin-1 receptor domain-containing protein [Saprospiraceae bacterium]
MSQPNAFLSHSSKDDHFVKALRQALEMSGASAWADSRELLPGDVLQGEIQSAISRCDIFSSFFPKTPSSRPG